jgi:predicted DNA-binding transcriptional regulator YafY
VFRWDSRVRLAAASRDGHLALRRVERQQALIERLRFSGVPLSTHQGRGGGVTLRAARGTVAVAVDLPEAAALMSSLAVLGPTVSDSAASAMRKLTTALDEAGRA